MNVLYTNADSLLNKKDELAARIEEMKDEAPQIIIVTEYKPKNKRFAPEIAEYNLDGYVMSNTNPDSHGRGTMIYISSSCSANEVKLRDQDEESLWMEVNTIDQGKMILGGVYRSPNASNEANRRINDNITELCSEHNNHKIVIVGDFNMPNIEWNTGTTSNRRDHDFIETISTFSYIN